MDPIHLFDEFVDPGYFVQSDKEGSIRVTVDIPEALDGVADECGIHTVRMTLAASQFTFRTRRYWVDATYLCELIHWSLLVVAEASFSPQITYQAVDKDGVRSQTERRDVQVLGLNQVTVSSLFLVEWTSDV